jgi:hypothetical protein
MWKGHLTTMFLVKQREINVKIIGKWIHKTAPLLQERGQGVR